MFLAQAAAALAAGAMVKHLGYPVMLGVAAGTAGAAALVFRALLGDSDASKPATQEARVKETGTNS